MVKKVIVFANNMFLLFVRYTGQLSLLGFKTIYLAFVPPMKGHRILTQMLRVGPGSFFIAALVAFFIGIIMSLQMAYQMIELSAEIYIPSVVAVSLTRELAPVLTALIVAGRFGAGITAEIGSMVVTEQVDALKAFAVDPVKYLVVPRFLALIVMLPILTIFADLIGILGSFVLCIFKLDISAPLFFSMVVQALTMKDVMTGLIKTIFFGAIIAIVGCQQGFKVKSGAEGVGKATTLSVVLSFILIIIADCLFTTVFYFILKI